MAALDVSNLTRDKQLYKKILVPSKDGQVFAKANCSVLIPSRFLDIGLLFLSDVVETIGIFSVVSDDKFTVCRVPAIITLTPYTINDVTINGVDFKELLFKKDTVFMSTTEILRNNNVIKTIFNELVLKGHIPWFYDYDDTALLFSLANAYADSHVGESMSTFEVLLSITARNPVNKLEYYRAYVNKIDNPKKPFYIPLLSVYYSFTNTTNKIVGSYMSKGIVSALVNPSKEVETIEKLLRA